jgi:hypothetical protein
MTSIKFVHFHQMCLISEYFFYRELTQQVKSKMSTRGKEKRQSETAAEY